MLLFVHAFGIVMWNTCSREGGGAERDFESFITKKSKASVATVASIAILF